ncbi:Emopamil-binding protein [Parathielavia appendiculata]|uniref:Emopamil-binding protein n=1 Tax=Parathielavia appendiculata TaxID=2587402 RepID=A0AAN6TZ97_9PEZI|nr:Emopamil-binding protein [Parathielavia appendiculata]
MAVDDGHPYFPRDTAISGYAANTAPLLSILASFGGITGAFVLGCVILAKWHSPALKRGEQLTIAWFSLCGFLHLFFEGYFVLKHATIPSSQSLFAQLWKEYALSDSRYLTSDPFMLCIETLTVLTWAPLSFATALLTARNRPREQGTRHLLEAVVCVGHLYGVALYYGTCGFAEHMRGLSYSRPEAVYYWGYYVGMNAPWVVVPSVLLWQSGKDIQAAFRRVAEEMEGRKGR